MNLAHTYVDTLDRLQAGESITELTDTDLAAALMGVAADVQDRLARLNRFPNARSALELAGAVAPAERRKRVGDIWVQENAGQPLDAEEEALMALNATQLLETLKAEASRRAGRTIQ